MYGYPGLPIEIEVGVSYGNRRPYLAHPPIIAQMLAEFHTKMNIRGLRIFNGNISRFLVFCFLLRTSLSCPSKDKPISVHSTALSLGRPFETTRRHVNAFVESGICERTSLGVTIAPKVRSHPGMRKHLCYAHDCFVELVASGVSSGIFTIPSFSLVRGFSVEDGASGAADMMLAILDTNRWMFPEALDLAIYSAVLHVNLQRHNADGLIRAGLQPRHAVHVTYIARLLKVPESTIRRRTAPLTGPGLPFLRLSTGLLVSPGDMPVANACLERTPRAGSIRLIIQRAVAAGLVSAPSNQMHRLVIG